MYETDQQIKDKVYDIEIALEQIRLFPQTYDTILQHLRKNSTLQRILRRKIGCLCKEGRILQSTIPNTRFGQCIFYGQDKSCLIIFEADRFRSKTYCVFDSTKEGFDIKSSKWWELDKGEWIEHKEEKLFFAGKILKVI
jgi:hypothetical protein